MLTAEELILEEIRGMRRDIQNLAVEQGRVSERVDNLIDTTKSHIKADDEVHEDFDTRIRKTENFITDLKARVGTWATIIGALAGLASSWLSNFLTGNHSGPA